MSGSEVKNFDVNFNVPISNAGTLTLLNPITQGTSAEQRLGLQARIRRVMFQGGIVALSTTVPPQDQFKVSVFVDKQPKAGTPVPSDVYASGVVSSFANLSNAERFEFLWDTFINMPLSSNALDLNLCFDLAIDLKAHYNVSNQLIFGAMYLFVECNSGGTSWYLLGNSRVLFDEGEADE